MSREHVDHKQIQNFADHVVNLKRADAKEYREQVNRLREKLSGVLRENPDFELKKILLSGSLAKHTALKTINDIDVAVYVISAPDDVGELIEWLADRLYKVFPNMDSKQIVKQNYSVRVEFRGSGLDVDVVPVYQTNNDADDWGTVVSQDDGTKLKTNIRLHREFIKKYQEKFSAYTQVVRLLKWWAKIKKQENENFKFKSFMIELVLAKLYDEKEKHLNDTNDYPEIMLSFFDYIAKTDFCETVYFTDYVRKPDIGSDAIQVYDPVNASNNIARKYTESDKHVIVNEAIDAGDAIDAGLKAGSKELTVRYWQKIFGSSFNI